MARKLFIRIIYVQFQTMLDFMIIFITWNALCIIVYVDIVYYYYYVMV